MSAVARGDLIARMAEAAGWPKAAAARALHAMLTGMRSSLRRGDAVTLIGFGTLSVARRRPRTMRNPRTGRTVTVSGKIPRFRPSRELRQAVR